jgi:adenylate cyclase
LVLTCASAACTIIGDFELGATLIDKALLLDPNSAWAWQRSGWIRVYQREAETAIHHFQRSLRLSPLDPITFNVFVGIGAAYAYKGEYDRAIEWVKKGLRERPDAVWTYRLLTVTYYHAGRLDEARTASTKLVSAFPNLTISRLVESTPCDLIYRQGLIEAFRALGLPE